MAQSIDLTGYKTERLTVVRRHSLSTHGWLWECICTCGNTSYVLPYGIKSKKTKSCGCLRKETSSLTCKKRNTTHLLSLTDEYKIWQGIKKRCLNKKTKAYKNYGGRGITICDSWLESFENFYKDLGARPSKKHQIDRIDNDKGYDKDNCKWVTSLMQNYNRRITRRVVYQGSTYVLSELARIKFIPYKTLWKRIKVNPKYLEENII